MSKVGGNRIACAVGTREQKTGAPPEKSVLSCSAVQSQFMVEYLIPGDRAEGEESR